MEIYCQNHPNFNYCQIKKMYEKYVDKVGDNKNLDEVLLNTHFYSFYENNVLIGCIYFYLIDGKMYLNAFANRNTHLLNIECLKKSLTFYNCDIYAKTDKKPAIYCLLKCGFQKISDNLYKRS